ncbi:hypothetical protein F443_13001 [Phytophthora nicotianae P1569]|uniref:Uncharacterized protein n=1 Tax=Phytophthora nicotianae P1569 TaxID=1317065 RepID=V9ER95_PHYNI|nr:hypothetical protein F443_13001 [Phytophthora nicotianae P1569]
MSGLNVEITQVPVTTIGLCEFCITCLAWLLVGGM